MFSERPNEESEALPSVSRRLVRNVSQKQRKKSSEVVGGEEEDDCEAKWPSLRCLSLYSRGGGCKVGAENEFGDPIIGRRRSNASSDESKGYKMICGGTEETGIDCFSSVGVKEKRFWRKHNRKESSSSSFEAEPLVFLPDDILEMCLVRLPMTSLVSARLVCKKWRQLTTADRFLRMRREGSHQSQWVLIFGAVKDGFCSGEIHALDVSLEKWHRIESNVLKGRFMFSVAAVQDEIFIVGGCSSLTNFGKVDRSSFKTHKGVIAFGGPLGRSSWRKVASMKFARSAPVLGVFEVSHDFVIVGQSQSHQNRQDRRARTRVGGVSDVYEDPHRLSLRRHHRNASDENKSHRFSRPKGDHHTQSGTKYCHNNNKRFLLISVGGHGSWDEPLETGEIYDSVTNKWTEIQRLPIDIGAVCSGVVCNGTFYVYSDTDKLAGYDIERGFWVRVQTATPFPPRVLEYYPKLVACCNNRLFMLSVSWCEGDGQIGRRNKAVRKLWELDLYSLTWNEVSVHPDAPMDWNASFAADRSLIFGIEMFKIFGQVLNFLTVCDVSKDDREMKWSHVSRNRVAHEFDASSCVTKSMAVLRL